MISMPATLATARLSLRAPCVDDADAVFRVTGDPVASRYMVWPTAQELDDVTEFLDDVGWGWSNGDDFTYAVVVAESADMIGLVSCQFSDEGAEIGFILRRDCWGQGLATEAASAVLAAAQGIDDLYRIWACCDPDNIAAQRVLAHLGLVQEGTLRCRSARPNLSRAKRPRDDVIMAWIRD